MSDFRIGLLASLALVGIPTLLGLKFVFWSGNFPPNGGWSKRQMSRMKQGKSPWTIECWAKYPKDRAEDMEAWKTK